jgi:hypothetical protein
MFSRRAAVVFGSADLLTATLVVVGVFLGLPSRWAPVDAGAIVLAALLIASGAGLVLGKPWASRMARVTSGVSLAMGLGVVSVLAITATWLSGVYGPVGRGGAVILALVAALALPYLVVMPVVRLVWLRQAGARS